MSKLFPEQPILFYPSLACRFGTEEAILLSVYYQYACHHGVINAEEQAQFILRRREWQALSPFFDEDKLAQLTSSLVDQGVLDAQFQANGSIRVTLLDTGAETAVGVSAQPAEPMRESRPAVLPERLADVRRPSEAADSIRSSVRMPEPTIAHTAPSMIVRGPAPSFGGSTGWAKPKDDLQLLFERQEQHHQQLKEITPNWQPQSDTLQLLAKKSITDEFSLACADQFVAYYMGQGQRKKSWEQPFMKWVMREWVGAQKKQYREQVTKDQQGYSGERDQTRARQDKRERITTSVMDINNTDW
ncbi:MAG: DnaT-like ssDNA-binding domain-containing protein [Motiliproteus sp.]